MYWFQVVALSVLAILGMVVVFLFLRQAFNEKMKGNTFLVLLIYVFAWVIIFRLILDFNDKDLKLNALEKITNSFLHTLQSFSMNEDYTEYLKYVKRVLNGDSVWEGVERILSLILTIIAPLVGGAALIDILLGIFPRLKIIFRPRRSKFVFSELNENSITLAEDIFRDNKYRGLLWKEDFFLCFHLRPLLIFTNVQPDPDSEEKAELITRAKELRAICLKTDIRHISFNSSKALFYFLINYEDESKNISMLYDLLYDPRCNELWPKKTIKDKNTENDNIENGKNENENNGSEEKKLEITATGIIVICQSDYSVNLVNSIISKSGSDKTKDVIVRPIRDYTNMALNLVYHIPMFLCLAGKQMGSETGIREKKFYEQPGNELHVTLIGSGSISEEIFKTIFWCGQMADYHLNIHVLSKNACDMEMRIRDDCPELFASCEKKNPILKVYADDGNDMFAPPYASCDFKTVNDAEFLSNYPENVLNQTDYYVIALGEDKRNIYVADMLAKEVQRRNMDSGKDRHPVIVPIIFDPQLAEAVKKTDPGKYCPYMIPYGTLYDRFNYMNIFMDDVTEQSLGTDDLYNRYNLGKQEDRIQDEYKYWSNVTRSIHAPYKLYSLTRLHNMKLNLVFGQDYQCKELEIKNGDSNDMILAWMEHRRWNAYLRSQGFACLSDRQHAELAAVKGDHKSVDLKLHSCLVESRFGVMSLELDKLPLSSFGDLDYLDLVSVYDYLIKKVKNSKKYDPDDMKAFYDIKELLLKNGGRIMEKYDIKLDGLEKVEYKHYDGIDNDKALQDIVTYVNKKQQDQKKPLARKNAWKKFVFWRKRHFRAGVGV